MNDMTASSTDDRPVVVRFAPSPTGYLHIGGARTALFNWLFAKHNNGRFLLRIEDTDRARSTEDAIAAILDGIKWLELDWEGEAVSQFEQRDRHAEVAHKLLAEGKAYKCFCSPVELQEMREKAKEEGRPVRYDGRWRDRDDSEAPVGVAPVIRLKAPQEGETTQQDLVQGPVSIANAQLDDFILLRADGTPTYMLSVVVDDHDMGITHVIRGDDHLTNTFRQIQLYRACGWTLPKFAHIPLIHGPDGAKLSKRHGALGVDAYRDMGYLPEAMRNYLLRLGWGHGDEEFVPTERAIELFDLKDVGRAAARFDFAKLENLNGQYMRQADDQRLVDLIAPALEKSLGRNLGTDERARLRAGMPGLKERAKTLVQLADSAWFYVREDLPEMDEKAQKILSEDARRMLAELSDELTSCASFDKESLEALFKDFAERKEMKLGKVAQPVRAALTGTSVSPSIFEAAAILGKEKVQERLEAVLIR